MIHRLIAGFFAFAWLAPPLWAQTLTPPDEVAIYVHSGVRNTEFVEPLVCELTKVLVAPVRARTLELALTPDLLESAGQFSPKKIALPFVRATVGNSDQARPFRYLILGEDLRSKPLNYVFAETYGGAYNLSVMSVVRLTPGGARLTAKQIAETTERRVYKLMLKSVAIMSGLRSDGCVMMFPRSLEELDHKSSEYCPNDRAALVAARVIKDKPSESCSTVVAAR